MHGEIFRDVTVALTTSFRMASTPAVDAGATRRALITVASLHPSRSRMQSDWVKRLVGQPSRVVDLSGLSRLEARAQCALVREAVANRLSIPEACAMLARFSQTPSEKQMGVSGLVAHFSVTSSAPTRARDLLADPLADPMWDLLWRHYLPQRYGDGLSLREIARRTRVSKSALSRRASELDHNLGELEQRAFRNLEQSFVPDGLCEALLARISSNPNELVERAFA